VIVDCVYSFHRLSIARIRRARSSCLRCNHTVTRY
jgi:hypothetical protein